MFGVFVEVMFEVLMTQVALFDLYTDFAFTNLVYKEGMTTLAAFSLISIIAISIPKIYALVLTLMMMFNCCANAKAREEDTRRKWAHRILTFNEMRLEALNVEYTRY